MIRSTIATECGRATVVLTGIGMLLAGTGGHPHPALACEPTERAKHVYHCTSAADPPRHAVNYLTANGRPRNEVVIEINGIPVKITRCLGGGGGAVCIWLGSGKNRVRVHGPHMDAVKAEIVQIPSSVLHKVLQKGADEITDEDRAKYKLLAEVRLVPGQAGAEAEFSIADTRPMPQADELDTSELGRSRTVREIEALFTRLRTAAKTEGRATLGGLVRTTYYPGLLRQMQCGYWPADVNDIRSALEGYLMARYDIRQDATDPKLINANDKMFFAHGKRGVLLYKGFDGNARPYFDLYEYSDGSRHGWSPMILIRQSGQWTIWQGQSL